MCTKNSKIQLTFSNDIATIRKAICERIAKITELQNEIDQQESELFKYMTREKQFANKLVVEME